MLQYSVFKETFTAYSSNGLQYISNIGVARISAAGCTLLLPQIHFTFFLF